MLNGVYIAVRMHGGPGPEYWMQCCCHGKILHRLRFHSQHSHAIVIPYKSYKPKLKFCKIELDQVDRLSLGSEYVVNQVCICCLAQ